MKKIDAENKLYRKLHQFNFYSKCTKWAEIENSTASRTHLSHLSKPELLALIEILESIKGD